MPFGATVFIWPRKHSSLLPSVLKNFLERTERALPASVCSPSAPTKEVRHEKELYIQGYKDVYTKLFIKNMFTIMKNPKQSECPRMGECDVAK